jgi:uncharacterized oxidoreductase
MPQIPADKLKSISINIFKAIGIPDAKAETVATLIIEANLAGHDSHGLLRLPQYVLAVQAKTIDPHTEIEIVSQTASTALIDGHWGFGQVIATQAMEIAIEKARAHAITAVNVYNSNHIGRLADYVLTAAQAGMVGLLFLNGHGADQGVAPWGGIARRLGTNPFACALPTQQEDPILIDLTTSTVAGGKIRAYRNRGESLPEGWIIDAEGNSSTKPAVYLDEPKGALLPFGGIAGHKGYALSMLVEILAGAMCEAGCSRPQSAKLGNAFLALVINIEAFTPIADFEGRVTQLVDFVKTSATAPGFDEITIPGERSAHTRQERLQNGIPLDDATWGNLLEVARELEVPVRETLTPNQGGIQ